MADGHVLEDRTVEIDGARVHVQVVRTRIVGDHQNVLRDTATVRAELVGCGTLKARVKAGSYFLALGRQDAKVGHPAFDDRYIVKTNEPEALAYWFRDGLPDAVLATYDPHALHPFELALTPAEVVLTAFAEPHITEPWNLGYTRDYDEIPLAWPNLPVQVSRLDAAIAAAAAIARRGTALAHRWRELLTPLGLVEAGPVWRTDESYVAIIVSGRARVTLDFPWHVAARRDDGLRTRMSISWSGAAPAGDTRAGVDWLLVGDGRLSIGWERIVDDPGELAGAVALLDRWAQHDVADGPYR